MPDDGDIALLHGLEERRLRLGRGAVHLVGEEDVAEDRAPAGTGSASGRRASSAMMLVPMMSPGIRSGVNWMRENVRSRHSDRVLIRSGLAQPGHALEEHVAAGEQADQDLVHHVVVADDHLLHLGAKRPERLDKGLDALLLSSGRLRGLRHEEPLSRQMMRRRTEICPIIWVVPRPVNPMPGRGREKPAFTVRRRPGNPRRPEASLPSTGVSRGRNGERGLC